MNAKIPIKLLKPYLLAEVPRKEFVNEQALKPLQTEQARRSFLQRLRGDKKTVSSVVEPVKRRQNVSFNAVAWLRVPKSPGQVLSLVISYADSSGEYAVLVDEAEIREGFSLMLAGRVDIEAIGPIQYMRASCTGLKAGQVVLVDELYVQRIRPQDEVLQGARQSA